MKGERVSAIPCRGDLVHFMDIAHTSQTPLYITRSHSLITKSWLCLRARLVRLTAASSPSVGPFILIRFLGSQFSC